MTLADLKPGDRVRWTRLARTRMFWARTTYGNGQQGGWALRAHVREFRRCIGVVVGPTDYNDVPIDHTDYDLAKVGPEVDVRWGRYGLRYAYDPADLERA